MHERGFCQSIVKSIKSNSTFDLQAYNIFAINCRTNVNKLVHNVEGTVARDLGSDRLLVSNQFCPHSTPGLLRGLKPHMISKSLESSFHNLRTS